MTHPKDIEYIRTMLPNISADVIEKQKILQPGNCVGFGGAFKLPMVIKMEMPNPAPNSNSCDVNNCWKVQGNQGNSSGSATSAVQTNGSSGGGLNNTQQQQLNAAVPNANANAQTASAPAPVQATAPVTPVTQPTPNAGPVKPNFVPPIS